MTRKKQPATAKPRPPQAQNGGRKPSPDGPRPQIATRVTPAELARLDAVCVKFGLVRSDLIHDATMARVASLQKRE